MVPRRWMTLLAVASAVTIHASAQAPDPLSRLGFLAGCWELNAGSRVTHEQWMAPLGGMMVGMSRTVAGGTAREWEALRIIVRNGTPVYAAQPGGREATSFTATSITDTSVVFANPEHDFPQRILYRMRGADSLIARIEGERNGAVRGIDFPMRRVACGG
ncbi:MAG TPA: DUF6265 family protein [Gemmatimonadales bacterium]|nr:DUF6265 family protein [Gemmatimonadales bacterium]